MMTYDINEELKEKTKDNKDVQKINKAVSSSITFFSTPISAFNNVAVSIKIIIFLFIV